MLEYRKGTTDFSIQGCSVVTLGKFNGLHTGHQKLLSQVIDIGRQGFHTVVFTFDGVIPENQMLITAAERQKMLSRMGIDYLMECPFVPALTSMEPESFVKEILVDQLHIRHIVVGSDFRFGFKRRGDTQLLQKLGQAFDFKVYVIEKETFQGREVSSTWIKELIAAGEMELGHRLLGYPYFVYGEVLHGRKLGRTLGMPTINLAASPDKILPPNGVYVSKTIIDGKKYPGITNIGYKPTVGAEKQIGIETNIFDFDDDLYGRKLYVELYAYKRPEQKFDSLDALKQQIKEDIDYGREYFAMKE